VASVTAPTPISEEDRVTEYLEVLRQQFCYRRSRGPGKDPDYSVPECWDRESRPDSWTQLCASCLARVALETDLFPCPSGVFM
jgi:hypothetical protein